MLSFSRVGKGCWGKERSDSVSICWLEIHLGTFLRREGCGGNQLFFSIKLQAALSQTEAKSGAVSLRQNPMIVFRYFKGGETECSAQC